MKQFFWEVCPIRINYKSATLKACFVLLIISDLFSNKLPTFFSYCDEIIALFTLLILLVKYNKIIVREKMILPFLCIICLGLVGNAFSGVRKEPLLVFFDLFMFLKPYTLMLYLAVCANNNIMENTIKTVALTSKVGVFTLFLFSLTTLVFPMDMVDIDGNFSFYTVYAGTIGFWSVCFASILYIMRKKHFLVYYFMAFIVVLRSNSGFGLLIMILLFFVYFFIGERHAFHWYYLVPLIPIGLYVGRGEIMNYLLNQNAPRSLLLRYAFITANRYFPFGAGFGTYGTKVAADNYSSLYRDYGFDSRWGMTPFDTRFLLDSYHPQIIGQFGYLGLLLLVVLVYVLITKYIFALKESHTRLGLLFMLGCWVICGLGFNTSNSWGTFVLGFIMLSYKTSRHSEIQALQVKK